MPSTLGLTALLLIITISLLPPFFANQKTEFSVCLIGSFFKNTYYIQELYYPEIIQQAFDHVRFKSCPNNSIKNTIIVLHTHPYKNCIFSEQDINSYEQNKQSYPDIMIALMCENNRFTFYKK